MENAAADEAVVRQIIKVGNAFLISTAGVIFFVTASLKTKSTKYANSVSAITSKVFHEFKIASKFPPEIIPVKSTKMSAGSIEESPDISVCTMELSCSTSLNTPLTLDESTSIASPTITEMKISCRAFPVTNGSNRLDGIMS